MGKYFPHISVISLYYPERTYVYCDLPLFLVNFDKFVSPFTAHIDMIIWTMSGLGFQNCGHKYLRGAASSMIGKIENHCGGLMLTLTTRDVHVKQKSAAIPDENPIIQKIVTKQLHFQISGCNNH